MAAHNLYIGPFKPDLEDAFDSMVASLRERERLAPVYVLVPAHVLARHLMRAVARRRGVCFNVRFMTFPDLAESVGTEEIVALKRVPLPEMADFLIARKAVNAKVGDGSYFASIRDFPSTPRAFLNSLTDLKKAGIAPVGLEEFIRRLPRPYSPRTGEGSVVAIEFPAEEMTWHRKGQGSYGRRRRGGKGPRNDRRGKRTAERGGGSEGRTRSKLLELAGIYAEVERLQTEGGYFDESDLLTIATKAAGASPLLKEAAGICLYGFSELNRLEREFFAVCLGDRPAFAFVPEDVAGHAAALVEWLGGLGFVMRTQGGEGKGSGPRRLAARVFGETLGPASGGEQAVSMVSAPGVQHEVEEIARFVLQFAARPDVSFSDISVLLRNPDEYERTLRDVLDSAGIPYVFLDGIPFADTLGGRLIRLLLRIRLGDYPRPDTMEFLGLAPLRPFLLKSFPGASPADWDRYSREAGVVEGRDHWRRVADIRRRVQWRIDRETRKPPHERDGAALALMERDLQSLAVLQRVLNLFLKRLSQIPERGSIGELMAALLRTLLSVVKLPEADRAVVKALAEITREVVADEQVSLETFSSLVEDLLQQRLPPQEVYRTGRVIISSLGGARGLPFRLVLIPGLVERSFPPPARQDPALLDGEREALNAAYGTDLITRERRAADEQFSFRHALGAASDSIMLSYPRLDAATGHVRVASHFLLRVAEAMTGQLMDYQSLEKIVTRIPLGRLDPGEVHLTSGEWDLSVVTRSLSSKEAARLAGLPGLTAMTRGTQAEASRWGQRVFTFYDGVLGIPVTPPGLMAATQLETYGTCPFRFFGERILGVREIDEPESVDTLSPLDRGSIIHEILEKFLSGLATNGLLPYDPARNAEYQRRMETVAQSVFRDFQAGGAVGYPFMWKVEQERILTDLQGFLALELSESEGYVPKYFEARFGPVRPGSTPPPGSMPDPLEISLRGLPMRLTGFIDRIDVHSSGRARVIDYKSGRIYGEKDDLFRGGKSLQLPLYLMAADEMLKRNKIPARTEEAQYYHVTGRGGFKRIRFTRDTLAARIEELKTILTAMAGGVRQGLFPQNPEGGENCRYCPFISVCGHGRVALVDRKAGDEQIAALVEMWEIE